MCEICEQNEKNEFLRHSILEKFRSLASRLHGIYENKIITLNEKGFATITLQLKFRENVDFDIYVYVNNNIEDIIKGDFSILANNCETIYQYVLDLIKKLKLDSEDTCCSNCKNFEAKDSDGEPITVDEFTKLFKEVFKDYIKKMPCPDWFRFNLKHPSPNRDYVIKIENNLKEFVIVLLDYTKDNNKAIMNFAVDKNRKGMLQRLEDIKYNIYKTYLECDNKPNKERIMEQINEIKRISPTVSYHMVNAYLDGLINIVNEEFLKLD